MDHQSPSTPSLQAWESDPAFAAAVMDASSALVLVLDRDARIVRFNRACETLTGYRFEEVRGRAFFELLPAADVERYRQGFARLVAENVPMPNELAWVMRDGERRILSWRNGTVLDAEGRVAFVVASGVDTTEQHRALAELAVTNAKLQAVLDSMDQPIVIADLRGRAFAINPAGCRALGVARLEDGPKGLADYAARFETRDAQGRTIPLEELPLSRAMRGEKVRGAEVQIRRPHTGETLVALASATPVLDADGQPILSVVTLQDVTEMKRVEEELRRSEELQRTLVDNSPDFISRFDASLRHIHSNATVCRQMGMTTDQLHGKTLGELAGENPGFFAGFEAALERAVRTGQPEHLEITLENQRGSMLLDLAVVPERAADGSIQSVLAIGRDVTKLRRALEASRASATELQAALDAMPAVVFTTHDRDARHIVGNRYACELFGVEPGTNLSMTPPPGAPVPCYRTLRDGRELRGDALPLQQVAGTGLEKRDCEFDLEVSEGACRRMLGNVVPLLGARGEPAGAIGFFVDITERRRSEQERERLLAEVGNLAERFSRLLSATEVFSAAATSERIAEGLLEEAERAVPPVLRSLVLVSSPEDAAQLQVLASRGDWEGQLRQVWFNLRLDRMDPSMRATLSRLEPLVAESREQLGERYPMLLQHAVTPNTGALVLLPLANEGRLVGVVGLSFAGSRHFEQGELDLMSALGRLCAQALERARLYESERRLRAEAVEEARLRERLMVVLGHDLRQPMSVVSAGIGSVLHRPDDLPARTQASLQRSLRAVGNMDSLIGALLDYSRLRAGRGLQLEASSGDLGGWCEAVLGEMRAEHPERTLQLERAGDLRGTWDRFRVGRLLGNLVSNALAFGHPHTPVRVSLRDEGERVAILVANQGAPIPPACQAEIFEPFGRARGEHARSRGGLGLGLFLVREIARAHGGVVEVRSSEEATVFAVTLPRQPPAS